MENEKNLSGILKKAYECFFNKQYDKALILFNCLNFLSRDNIYYFNIKACHILLQQTEKRLLLYKEDKFYKPKVSIIVTSYNNGIYLDKCLKSIVNQTLKDIEVICVDDCSTDGSQNLIKQYQKENEYFICIFHEQNISASQIIKNGLLKSRGEYVMFVDGKDALEENACEIAYNTINSQKTDIVHFGTTINNIAKSSESRIKENLKIVKPYKGFLKKNDVVESCFVQNKFNFQIWNKIYNGDIARLAAKNIVDDFYSKSNDLYLFFLFASFSTSYFGINTPLYRYNFGNGSTSGEQLSIEKYKFFVKEQNILNLLKIYCDSFYLIKNEKNIDLIENNFMNECFCKWRDYVSPKDKPLCFHVLCKAFSFNKVIDYLAKTYWNKRIEISEMILGLDYFKYKKRNKKIKNIVSYYRCIKNGGAQRVVSILCNRWAKMKDEYANKLYKIILVTDDGPEDDEYHLDKLVIREYVPNKKEYIKEKYSERHARWNEIIDKYDVDIVINNQWTDSTCYWDMLSVKGHPKHPAYIIHTHNTCIYPFLQSGDLSYDVALRYKICDGVIALSKCDEVYIKSFNINTVYIENPITFDPNKIAYSLYESNTIIWCGRIASNKRPLHAINMMKFVVNSIPNAKLLIVGDGSEEILKSMKDLSSQLNLNKNIEFIGFTNDTSRYYSKASVFICTSEFEGFPLAIGEAMAHRLPIVSYDMPYLSYMLDGRGIIAVPQEDFFSMSQQVIKLLSNKNMIKEIGNAAYLHIVDIFNLNIEEKWKKIFESIDNIKLGRKKQSINSILFNEITKSQIKGKKALIKKKNKECAKKIQDEKDIMLNIYNISKSDS